MSTGTGPPPAARGALDRLVVVIDAISTAAGWFAGWLVVPLTPAVAYEVVAPYLFNAPTRWVSTVTYMLYGTQFTLAAAYTLLKDGHIRTDVFYGQWSPRTRAIVDAVSYVFFFFPGLVLIFYAGTLEAWHAWDIGERAGGWRAYPFKAVIPLTALLLLLQGLSELIKCARVLLLGWPFEWPAIILVFVPLLQPAIIAMQLDQLWFATLIAVNLQTAFLSPPVAMAAYYLKRVAPDWELRDIYWGMAQFMVLQIVGLLLLVCFPEIALWFPRWLYGP